MLLLSSLVVSVAAAAAPMSRGTCPEGLIFLSLGFSVKYWSTLTVSHL